MIRLTAITLALLALIGCATPAAGEVKEPDAFISSEICMPRQAFLRNFLKRFQEKVVAKGVLRQTGDLPNMLFELAVSKQGNFTLAITTGIEDRGLITCVAGEGFGLKIFDVEIMSGHKM